MKSALMMAAAAALALAAAGCGERAVTVYKQGQYQGKPDNQPWDIQFKGDKLAWETAIKQRNDGQNEYSRGTPAPK